MRTNKVRLGEAIRRRRETMSPPLTMKQLAAATGLGSRRMGSIERGEWDAVRPTNRDAIERALGWGPGSWDAVLSGGEPTIVERPVVRVMDDDDLSYVLRGAMDADLETLRRLRIILEHAAKNGQK